MHKAIAAAVLAPRPDRRAATGADADRRSADHAAGRAGKEATKTKKAPMPGQLAARKRLKKCTAEWKEAKAAGKIEREMKWPKYWSACNMRLKAAG
jgi:hypothetical protein